MARCISSINPACRYWRSVAPEPVSALLPLPRARGHVPEQRDDGMAVVPGMGPGYSFLASDLTAVAAAGFSGATDFGFAGDVRSTVTRSSPRHSFELYSTA